MGHFPQANATQVKGTVNRAGAATAAAPRVSPNFKLGGLLLFVDQCFFGHYFTSCRKGNLNASSSARPASSVLAVVTMVTISLLWYGTVSVFFASRKVSGAYGRMRRWLDRVAGVIFAGFGAKMALDA